MKSHSPTSKQSVVWRGDLVRSRLFHSAYSDDRQDVLSLIDSLGFIAELPVEEPEISRLRMEKIRRDLVDLNRLPENLPTDKTEQLPVAPTVTWVSTQFRSPAWNARSQETETENLKPDDSSNETPVVRITNRPLATWSQLRSRLILSHRKALF